ncbi:MAG: MFS transporter [Chloroflexota bacterium]
MTGIEAVPEQPGRLGRLGRVSLLAPLAGRDYRLVWIGESVSLLGDQFNTIALAWLVLGLTGSGFALGLILIAAAIPRGTFLLVGGVLSDRISPRDLALVSNVARAVLTTLVAGLVIGDRVELWHLAAVGVVFGTVDAVFLPAINTLVPRLVPVERLAAANAVMQGTAQLVGTVGPAIAGIAVALIGVGAAFVVDAATFAFAALMLWFVRSGGNAPTPQDGPIETRPSILASLVEGGRIVLGDPVMRSIVILSTAANLAFTGSVVVGLPWLVLVRFGGDALTLGFLFAAYGAGSLVGVLAAGSLPHPRRFGSIVLAFVLLAGVGLGAVGLAPSAAVVAVILTAIGALNGWINVVVVAWVQGRTDPDVLGRTMSFLMLGSVVAAPLSLAIAAIVVDTNATALFLAAGALVIASAAVALANGLQRRMV